MVTTRVALGGLESPGEGHLLVVGRGWGEGLVSRGTAMTSGDRLRKGRAERCSEGGNQFRGVDRGGHRGGQRVGRVRGGGVGRPCTIIASRRSCPSRASIRRGVCSTSLCRSSSRRPGGRCPLWRHRLLPHERLGSRCHLCRGNPSGSVCLPPRSVSNYTGEKEPGSFYARVLLSPAAMPSTNRSSEWAEVVRKS